MKIITVIGARPQFIKAATVSRVLGSLPGSTEILVHTGQHYDQNLSDIFFEELDIPQPNYYLGIGSASHGRQTGQMLEAIEQVLLKEEPDWVLVYGDTNSTLAGALAAVKLHIPVAHIEAGLRSFNRKMPEEMNRILTDHASNLLFAPTQTAVENLLREGFHEDKVFKVGDVMYDAALYYAAKADKSSNILVRLDLEPNKYVLATVHRAENTDHPARLQAIFHGLIQVAQQFPIILPLHPRTRNALVQHGLLEEVTSCLNLIEPVGYLDMVNLEKNAKLIATDSGGVQKEAFFYCTPCITLRDETEWIELVESGFNRLIPPHDMNTVRDGLADFLDAKLPSQSSFDFYGDGGASRKIVSQLLNWNGFPN